jgi:CubicO group peptidase (beta-lactamase class C family)
MRHFPILALALSLMIAGLPGHLLADSEIRPPAGRTAELAPSSTIVRAPLGERADGVLREDEAKGYSGVILVAKDGEIVLRKGYGLANRSAAIPMTADSVVQIGSCTKDFTIVAILQLHERGLLNVKDPITKYFKDVPEDKRSITIWHLLTQRSGLIDHIGGDFEPTTKEEIIRGAMATTLLFAPGSDSSYSNMAFNLLAAIIEDVSKQSFDEYLRDHICNPLGLRDTGFLLPNFDLKRVAHGYLGDEDRGIIIAKPHAPDGPYWNLRGAGGILSTVTDMFDFYTALWDNRLMKPETRDMRFTPGQSVMLAGSDLVQYFFYNHEPSAGIDILLSSTSSAAKAPQVIEQVREALGLVSEKRTRQVETSPRTAKQPPTPEARARVDAFFLALASGDADKYEAMARENFTPDFLARRTPEERKSLLERIREDFGTLSLSAVQMSGPKTVVFAIKGTTGMEGRVELTLESGPLHRIERVAVNVGG